LSFRIFYDDVNFRLRGWRKAVRIFNKIVGSENKIAGELNFVVTNDTEIKKINSEFLQHNYFTDVIAFDNGSHNVVSGEIYLSIDTVKINALNYNVGLNSEVLRVMIHGLLHLCGYSDDTAEKKNRMREKENFWIAEFENENK
jgi:rRNA maturation RNase YbeY